jgi:phosphate transport system permease protein
MATGKKALAPIGSEEVEEIVRARVTGTRTDTSGIVFRMLLMLALFVAIVILAVLLIDQVTTGWSSLTDRECTTRGVEGTQTCGITDFLTGTLRANPEDSKIGIGQGLVGTFWIGVTVVLVAFPLGVGAAVWLEEYAKKGKLTSFIELNIRNLAGVPSVVYGILGLTILVKALDGITGGRSLISGAITLAVLVLPIVIITSSEALRAVPDSIREAGFGVGATRSEVIRSHVLPYAAPGILTGTVLALARALGEAAPLILVGAITGRLAGTPELFDPGQLTENFTAMPIVITTWAQRPEDGFLGLTAAAIIVLLVVVLLANASAILLRNYFETKRG